MSEPLDDLNDEELGKLVRNTAAFRAAAACARFADEVQELQENDTLAFDRLIAETHQKQGMSVSVCDTRPISSKRSSTMSKSTADSRKRKRISSRNGPRSVNTILIVVPAKVEAQSGNKRIVVGALTKLTASGSPLTQRSSKFLPKHPISPPTFKIRLTER